MRIETYRNLAELRTLLGPRKFGRICQKLVALGLRELGYTHVIEREIQGVDLDVSKAGGAQYAIEVKTTSEPYVSFATKDFEGLDQRSTDGYLPVLAVLRFSTLGNWLTVDARRFAPGRYLVDSLLAFRIEDLEEDVNSSFENVVRVHGPRILIDGPKFLDPLIKGH